MFLSRIYNIGYCSEGPDRDRSFSTDSSGIKKPCKRFLQTQLTNDDSTCLSWIPESQAPKIVKESEFAAATVIANGNGETTTNIQAEGYLAIPPTTIGTSQSTDTLTESTLSGPSSPSNLSACTLVGSTGSSAGQEKTNEASNASDDEQKPFRYGTAPVAPLPERSTQKPGLAKDTGIVTHSLPPTLTTTHYSEGTGPTTKLIQSVELAKAAGGSIDLEVSPTKINTTRHLSIGSVMMQSQGQSLLDRRPSAGANIIPQAALCQHRHSLQLNGGPSSGPSGHGSDVGSLKVRYCMLNEESNFLTIYTECFQEVMS